MIKRLFPAPLLSVFLFVAWLVLNRTTSAGQMILGAVFGLLIPVLTQSLRPREVHIRKPWTIVRLGLRVSRDSMQSNWAVLRLLLAPGSRKTRRPLSMYRCNCAIPMGWRCWP